MLGSTGPDSARASPREWVDSTRDGVASSGIAPRAHVFGGLLPCLAAVLLFGNASVVPSAEATAPLRMFQLLDRESVVDARRIDAAPDGGVLIADCFAARVRLLTAAGSLRTVAGTGHSGYSGDGGPAIAARLNCPLGVSSTSDGGFLVADSGRVRRVGPDGTISTVAGTGGLGHGGDGGAALAAQLNGPSDVAALADGGFLIAESQGVRRVWPNGVITTVAGGAGPSGTSLAANGVWLGLSLGLAATRDGGFLIADGGRDRVWRVSAQGVISIAAGSRRGVAGDGGLATQAQLRDPADVAVTADGGFLIADAGNARVRAVSPLGVITTVAGPGPPSYFFSPGQLYGGPARDYTLDTMAGVTSEPGGFLISNGNGNANSAILSVAEPGAPRLAVALQAPRVDDRMIRFPYRVTKPASVALDVLAGTKAVAHLHRSMTAAGRSSIALTNRLAAGLYGLRLQATDTAGERAQSRLGVFVVGDLTLAEARVAARRKARRLEGSSVSPTRCRRFSRTRTDCTLSDPCDTVASLRLHRRTGLVYFQPYECRDPAHGGPFAKNPRVHTGTNLVT